MSEKGIVPIVQKFLQNNHLFALECAEGWLFGRVVRRRICNYKPYSLIDANGDTVNIAASSHQAELWLRDSRNTAIDIIYLDDTTNKGFPWFLHGAIGWKPHQILVYPRIPEGGNIPGKFPQIDPIKPSSGDLAAYYSGVESPYDEPTDFMEYVIPPKMHISHEFYNKDDRSHNPVANILFALYHVQLFKPTIPGVGVHNRIIRDIALRHVPAAFFTIGYTSEPYSLGVTVIEDWKAVPITLDQAITLEVS
jgi:hypothetical protein